MDHSQAFRMTPFTFARVETTVGGTFHHENLNRKYLYINKDHDGEVKHSLNICYIYASIQ